jgi:hypothetical protein
MRFPRYGATLAGVGVAAVLALLLAPVLGRPGSGRAAFPWALVSTVVCDEGTGEQPCQVMGPDASDTAERFWVSTRDGTARAGENYRPLPADYVLIIKAGVTPAVLVPILSSHDCKDKDFVVVWSGRAGTQTTHVVIHKPGC